MRERHRPKHAAPRRGATFRRGRGGTSLAVAAITAVVASAGPGSTAWAQEQAQDQRGPECPAELDCNFLQAGAGRFAPADRPHDGLRIRFIVIHDTEETYKDTVSFFTSPGPGAAANYLVRSADGKVTQFIRTRDVAYHAGNFWFNSHSIGIEHEGFLAHGDQWYTEAMYESSARLVRYLAARFHIPLDRDHILGHEEIPGQEPATVRGMHYDPGPYWDWEHYFDLLRAPLSRSNRRIPHLPFPGPQVVVIDPRFEDNEEPLEDCEDTGCTVLPRQGSNIVYLHTEPRPDAPLISDPDLHPDGAPGTTDLSDWSARALTGDPYVIAARARGWTGIWFNGRLGWFANPHGDNGYPVRRIVVTPRLEHGTIPVYGAAYPEPGAYPSGVEVTDIKPLRETIAAGQFYVALQDVPGDDYGKSGDPADPTGRIRVIGNRRLIEISFNHRRAFVDANDVLILG